MFNNLTLIGPIPDKVSLSYGLTYSISNNAFFGWFHTILSDSIVILILLVIIFLICLVRVFVQKTDFYNFINLRQEKLIGHCRSLQYQLTKRDIISINLINLAQKKYK